MIEQRSPEWFEQRKGRVTGSRIGAILGLSPFSNPRDVMRQMVRDYHGAPSEFEGNCATAYGTQHEPMALFDFELETGLSVAETGLHVHPDHDWLAASPDGLIGDDAVLEIKCPYGLRNGGEFKPLYMQDHYFAQVQFEMFCTGRTKCHFYQWSPHGSQLETIELDMPYINNAIPRLKAFHEQYLQEIKNPDRHLAPLVKDKSADEVAAEYEAAKAALDEAKARLDAAREKVLAVANGEKSNVSGLLVCPQHRQGAISYAKVVKDLLPDADLEAYRGEPSTVWVIK